jgi:hypothetical protein
VEENYQTDLSSQPEATKPMDYQQEAAEIPLTI